MAHITADRVRDTSTSTGTGNFTVSGTAPIGFRTLSAVLSVGDTFYYAIQGQGTSEWEVGLGTYSSANVFARTTVLSSSNSGSAVSFSASTKDVFLTLAASKTTQVNASGIVDLPASSTINGVAAVTTTGSQTLTNKTLTAPVISTISNTGTLTLPTSTDTLVGRATTDTLTNKTLGAGTVVTTQTQGNNSTSPASTAYVDQVVGTSSSIGSRNRIINGAMVIDQRNAGAAITVAAGGIGYPVDRQYIENFQSGTITAQRSSTAPAGFTNSVIHTVTVTDTPGAGDYLFTSASVEGFNIADFGWGAANAQPVTLSFWVRSSVTGTYGIGLRNGASNYSYIATYTVSVANTWEKKTITIAGPTSGTWYTDNQLGVRIFFDLGSGSNFNGTANAWQSGTYWRTSGCVNWIGNASATFYITGVQLEAGSVATPFEREIYSTTLAKCQRYYQTVNYTAAFYGATGNAINQPITHAVVMRATPTATTTTAPTYTNGSNFALSTINGAYSYAGATVSSTGATVVTGAVVSLSSEL